MEVGDIEKDAYREYQKNFQRNIRKNKRTLSVLVDKQKLDLLEAKLNKKKLTKTQWINMKIDEELK